MALNIQTWIEVHMSDVILAAAPPLDNSIDTELSHLFYLSFQYFSNKDSLSTTTFINALKTFTGLGYVACFVSETDLKAYQKCFNRLLNHSVGDFRCHPGALLLLTQAVAKMVILAMEGFHHLNYPDYYAAFIHALEKVLDNEGLKQAGKSEAGQQVLLNLQQKIESFF